MSTSISRQPHVVIASGTSSALVLLADRMYTLTHLGKDGAGSDSLLEVYCQCDGAAVETSYAAKEGKLVLQTGKSVVLPARATDVNLKTAGTSVAVQVTASEKLFGGVS